ncbi:ABC-three component system protein [Cellulomonas sp. CW35]|uniref:ABC-three component system protein n=1 Tax=Cellulomonas sp. CW35 TaxID=3458249 RepID=UPI0040347AED
MLVADTTSESTRGDSRNGTGKTSFVRILRYLVGGGLADELRADQLTQHTFAAEFGLPDGLGREQDVRVSRAVSPTTRVSVSGWSRLGDSAPLHADEWREVLAQAAFGLPPDVARPTPGQLWGQFARTYFGSPTKSYPTDTDWETGVKLGYLFGLSPEILVKAGEITALERQRNAVKAAVREGAIAHLSLDEAGLRTELVEARRRRDRVERSLSEFRVDDQYADHQNLADLLTRRIQALNDETLALQRRTGDIERALEAEVALPHTGSLERLEALYAEVGLVLPGSVRRRFEEVHEFHSSVVSNRRTFLERELQEVVERKGRAEAERRRLDSQRAEVMRVLRDSVALETFLDAQRSFAELSAEVAYLERRLEAAVRFSKIGESIRIETATAVRAVRSELEEWESRLDQIIAMYAELAGEIYDDRAARLRIAPTTRAILKVEPQIDGDASEGIRGVETFLLDMVCIVSALPLGRAPGLLVHDSHLFDSVDRRQVASCLNIGARLAVEHGFQYVVTMNSDFLDSVESEGAFDRSEYAINPVLTDASEEGGLFGFRFE